MEESKTADSRFKPFKTVAPDQADLVMQKDVDENSSASAWAVVVASEADHQNDVQTIPQSASAAISGINVATKPSATVKSKRADLLYRLGISTKESRDSGKSSKPSKKSMTQARLVSFVVGLFVAGMAGSCSNGLITAGIEKAFPPQYVKDFYKAQSLPDKEQAFSGMQKALAQGQQIEPLSRRFTDLTASLAEDLDDNARYLEAKSEWAKAAMPSDVAAPDLREQKRSYLINEAHSEHLAFASQMKTDVDQNLLREVEAAGSVFEKSAVNQHVSRAFDAFLAAGELAADNKDFERARKNLFHARQISYRQWQDGGWRQYLLEARWRAELQEILAKFSTLKNKPISHYQFTPGNLSFKDRRSLQDYFGSQNWDKLNSIFETAQKKHLQNMEGDTLVSEMYSEIGKYNNSPQRNNLFERLPYQEVPFNRANLWIARAYYFNAKAESTAGSIRKDEFSSIAKKKGFVALFEAAANLRYALERDSEVAFDPSFIKAIQTNLAIADRLSNWSFPQAKLVSELHAINIAMTGDEAQFYLDEISYDASHHSHTSEFMKHLLRRAADRANEIGGVAGDEFYARAVGRSGAVSTMEFVDVDRFLRGRALLVKRFATDKT